MKVPCGTWCGTMMALHRRSRKVNRPKRPKKCCSRVPQRGPSSAIRVARAMEIDLEAEDDAQRAARQRMPKKAN